MNEMIKEVYEYVSPKPQIIEEKPGKKAPVKKGEEIVPVDIYAG